MCRGAYAKESSTANDNLKILKQSVIELVVILAPRLFSRSVFKAPRRDDAAAVHIVVRAEQVLQAAGDDHFDFIVAVADEIGNLRFVRRPADDAGRVAVHTHLGDCAVPFSQTDDDPVAL